MRLEAASKIALPHRPLNRTLSEKHVAQVPRPETLSEAPPEKPEISKKTVTQREGERERDRERERGRDFFVVVLDSFVGFQVTEPFRKVW